MIGAVSSISSVAALGYARKVAGTDAVFRVPESALRTNGASPAQGVPERDPVADSVELSRDFPQLLIGATYAPPPIPQALGLRTSGGVGGLDQEEDAASGYSEPEELADAAEGSEDPEGADETAQPGEATGAGGEKLSEDEQRQLDDLKSRDREVRAHEQAHKAVGGSYSGSISYEFQQGPDGNKYAVGGEVSIDTSPERDPDATIAKMRQVKAAAMAPAQPSGQDRSVAAQANQTESAARQEASQQDRAEAAGEGGNGEADGAEDVDGAEGVENNNNGVNSANRAGGMNGTEASAVSAPGESAPNGVDGPASANSFMNRYAENAYGVQSFAAATMSMSMNNAYSPLNVVA